MQALKHPSIINLYEIYESEDYIYLVLDYLKGGTLIERIQTKSDYNERDASNIIKKLLGVIDFLQGRNVIHRDLKPDNIVFM